MKDSTELSDFQAAALRYCFAADPPDSLLVTLGGDRRGWAVYREMSRKRLARMVRAGLRRTFMEVASELGEDAGADLIDRFFDERGVQSDYMRDCVPEFASWLSDLDRSIPGRVLSLATLERTRWQVRDHPAELPGNTEFDFERTPVVNPTAVHLELPPGAAQGDSTGAGVRELVTVYRDTSNSVREMHMTPFARALIRGWSEHSGPAIVSARATGETLGLPVDDAFVRRMCTALERFLEDELVLGSC